MVPVTTQAHRLIRQFVSPGDTVIDATAGNGHDTLFLAELTGANGTVYAIDVQANACEACLRRLTSAGIRHAHILTGDHAELLSWIPRSRHGTVAAVMFNLGYLPGGNKQIITQPESTRQALSAALTLLRPGGIISVVVYRGHPGGNTEALTVEAWLADAARQGHHLLETAVPETASSETGPMLLALEKRILEKRI